MLYERMWFFLEKLKKPLLYTFMAIKKIYEVSANFLIFSCFFPKNSLPLQLTQL